MRTTVPVSPYAMQHLDLWVPRHLREECWRIAFKTYQDRAPTTDGTGDQWAASRANVFWPIYVTEKPKIE